MLQDRHEIKTSRDLILLTRVSILKILFSICSMLKLHPHHIPARQMSASKTSQLFDPFYQLLFVTARMETIIYNYCFHKEQLVEGGKDLYTMLSLFLLYNLLAYRILTHQMTIRFIYISNQNHSGFPDFQKKQTLGRYSPRMELASSKTRNCSRNLFLCSSHQMHMNDHMKQ